MNYEVKSLLKRIMQYLLIFIIMIIIPGCSYEAATNDEKESLTKTSTSKVPIVVTFNPMKEFVKAIGKEKVEITIMVPTGMVPHNFKPKQEHLNDLKAAKLFVYNGMGLGDWTDEALKAVDNKDLIVIEAAKGIEPLKNPKTKSLQNYGDYDPHTWLSLKNAQIASKNIKDALVKIDPMNRDYYEKNYEDFFTELDNLYTEYKDRFSKTNKRVVLTGHSAFGYLCREFNFEQLSIENFFANSKPSIEEIDKISKYLKDSSTKVVLLENETSSEILNALKKDVGVEVHTTYCLEKGESGKSYIESMRLNLDNIYKSMAK